MANNAGFDQVLQAAAVATGNGTALPCGNLSGCGLQVTGISGDTITCEGTIDTNWVTVQVWSYTSASWASTITANGLYWVPLAGLDQFRARISTYGAGTITATAKGVDVAGPAPAPAVQTSGTIGKVTQGTANTVGNAWPTYASGAAANGLSKGKKVNLNATVTAVKASAGTLYLLTIENSQAAKAFIQIFDVASGGVTLNSTVPDWEFEVAANSTYTLPIPASGLGFGTAISIASTTAEFGNTGTSNGLNAYWSYA